jgi:hypothetical protein
MTSRIEFTGAQAAAWQQLLASWRRWCAHPTDETRRDYYERAVPEWERVKCVN